MKINDNKVNVIWR